MTSATITRTPGSDTSAAAHGPVAGAVKWAFKSYFRAVPGGRGGRRRGSRGG